VSRFRIEKIVYELTGACNQCCRFCYNHWRDGSTPIPAPDPALARRTLRKLLSEASVGTLSFSGGEPLLLPNVHDLVFHARFRGSRVNILTNGALLSASALENFQSLGVSIYQIPLLSADPEIHDYLTTVPGSFEKALDALKRVGSVGKGAAVLVITKVNIQGIGATLELIKSCGIRTVMVNRFNLGGQGILNADELVPSRIQLEEAFGAVEAFAAQNMGMRFVSGVCTPLCLLDVAQFPHIIFSTCRTDLSKRPVTVNYAGDVRFCNHSPVVLGNIFNRPIKDILTDESTLARYSAVPEKCADCPLLPRCAGGCRAASEQVFGTFAKEDPIITFAK
jgi:radical SAM protein with 4Fe4S-binding SPASM domain